MYSDIIRGSSSGYVRNEKNNVDTQRIYTVIKIKSADTEYNKHLPHPFYYLLVMILSLPIYAICHIRICTAVNWFTSDWSNLCT